jgi:hypothetical protein
MSGTTKPIEERDIDEIIEETRQSWHNLKMHLQGEEVTR